MLVALIHARGDPVNAAADPKQLARDVIECSVQVRKLLECEVAQARKQHLLAQFTESVVRHVRASCRTGYVKDMRGKISV
jgi:chorismate mutase